MKRKHIGTIIAVVGILGFVLSNIRKDEKLIFEKRVKQTGIYIDSLEINEGHSYTISLWSQDEEGGGFTQWPETEARIRVYTKSDTLYTKRIHDFESNETGGLRRAKQYTDFSFEARKSETLFLMSEFIKGDECETRVYSDISEGENILPGVFIIVLVVGIFVFLKYRAKEQNSRD